MPNNIVPSDPKNPLFSKTVWVNVLTAVIAVLTLMSTQDFIPEEVVKWIFLAVAILNILLRFVTDQPISVSKISTFKIFLTIALLFSFATWALAADIKVDQPPKRDTLVRVSTSATGSGYAWFVTGPEGFADIQTYNNGKSVAFAGAPGKYSVLLVVLAADTLDQGQAIIEIPGVPDPTPNPNPGPNPNPDPTPVTVPDGYRGFTKLSYDAAMQLPVGARSKASAMADNFEAVAAAIAAGSIKEVKDANAEMASRNRNVLGAGGGEWLPWLQTWGQHADKENQSGMRSVTDYKDAYLASAEGLRLVK